MNLICNIHETDRLQCSVVEDGIQCNHGVRNVKRLMCSKHYARLQRNGNAGLVLPNGGSLSRQRQNEIAEHRSQILIEQGLSTICLCSHVFLKHSPRKGCREKHCKCNKFEGVNPTMLFQTMAKMKRLGFSDPLNDSALCKNCSQFIRVGKWYDQISINRMREHLRLHILTNRNLRVG